jgi:hypothetical protein
LAKPIRQTDANKLYVVTTDRTTWTYTPLHCLNDVTVIQQSTTTISLLPVYNLVSPPT